MPHLFRFDDNEISKVPTWVRLPHLPLELWNEKALSMIASRIGTPIQSDKFTSTKERVSFARIYVEIDVAKDLKRVVNLELPSKEEIKQEIIYEYAPSFCKLCKAIGHSTEACEKRKKELERIANERKRQEVERPSLEKVVGNKVYDTHLARVEKALGQSRLELGEPSSRMTVERQPSHRPKKVVSDKRTKDWVLEAFSERLNESLDNRKLLEEEQSGGRGAMVVGAPKIQNVTKVGEAAPGLKNRSAKDLDRSAIDRRNELPKNRSALDLDRSALPRNFEPRHKNRSARDLDRSAFSRRHGQELLGRSTRDVTVRTSSRHRVSHSDVDSDGFRLVRDRRRRNDLRMPIVEPRSNPHSPR